MDVIHFNKNASKTRVDIYNNRVSVINFIVINGNITFQKCTATDAYKGIDGSCTASGVTKSCPGVQ